MFGEKKDPVEEVIKKISEIPREQLFLLQKHIIRELDFRDDEDYENQEG